MLKRVVTYILSGLAITAFGAYIWFGRVLRDNGSDMEICTGISISIMDSSANRLVSPSSVRAIISRIDDPVGKRVSDINVSNLEKGMTGMGAILHSDVAIDRSGLLFVEITQRHPILRFQSSGNGYYMDDTGFCFPLSDLFTSDVPVVSGAIREEDQKWRDGMLELGTYLDRHPFWHTQIEQMDVDPDGCLTIYSKTSDQAVLFGMPEHIDSKLSRLFAFYRNIAPVYGWDRYSVVDLKYSGQIVCTPAEKEQQHQ